MRKGLGPRLSAAREPTVEWIPTRIIVRAPEGQFRDGQEYVLVPRPHVPPGVPFSAAQARELREAYEWTDATEI
jgi:hypothetical protein